MTHQKLDAIREYTAMFPECVMLRTLAFKVDDLEGLSDSFMAVFPNLRNPFYSFTLSVFSDALTLRERQESRLHLGREHFFKDPKADSS